MRRREFIALLTGAAVAWPLGASAEQSWKIPRIGVLWHAGNEAEEAIYLGALRQGFGELGYVDGKTMMLENRFAREQYDRFDRLAAELVESKVDVLVAVTRPAAAAAQRATATIPVVFISVPDPVGSKLVKTLGSPGGNITGLSNMAADLNAKRLELFKEVAVSLSHVALLVNPSDPEVARQTVEELRAGAVPLNLRLQPFEVGRPGELERVFSTIAQDRAQV
jgi:putative ABC transport system substrate-binding protein